MAQKKHRDLPTKINRLQRDLKETMKEGKDRMKLRKIGRELESITQKDKKFQRVRSCTNWLA